MINNRYQILEEIGSGGIGKVLKATDLLKRNTVAIKILLGQEPEQVERFKNEFLLLRKLYHPNIVKAYDFGFSDKGEPYFSMEHIEGKDWKAFLQPLDYSKFLYLTLQICSTLDFLHSKQIIHGDIKPSNLLITTRSDGQLRVKFTDFGFAQYEKIEKSLWWKGTLPYLAPEVIRGEKYTAQADLYSIGILIYESLFGKPPFDEEDPLDLAKSHLEKDPVIPEEPSISPELKDLILKLLEKDTIDRFFSAKDVMDQIQKISGVSFDDSEFLLAKCLINSSDFVGRQKEFSILRQSLIPFTGRGSKFVLIMGEPGIGKATLADEFAAWAQVEGFSAINISLKEHKAIETLQDRSFQFLKINSRPAVLILQHLESTHDSFFNFLSDFIHKTRYKRILVCLTLMADLPSPKENQRVFEIQQRIRAICGSSITSVKLSRLTEIETEKMFCSMFGCSERTQEIATAIHQETGGNPLLVRQLAHSLAEETIIRRKNGKWSIKPEGIEKSKIPIDVANEMERRLTRLKPESSQLLACASVWGKEIELDVLVQVSGFRSAIVSSSLREIISHHLMEKCHSAGKEKLRFTNNFVRRLVHAKLDPEKRKALHKKAGEILERKVGSIKESHAYDLANHLYEAGEMEKAFEYSLLAAAEAEAKSNHSQAIIHYTCVLELYDEIRSSCPRSLSKGEILENLADQFDQMGELNKSLELYRQAVRIWESVTSNHEKTAILHQKIGRICEKMGKHEKAVEFLERSAKIFKETGSLKDYARTLVNLGWVYSRKSDYEKARSQFEEAVSILRKEVTSKEMGFALSGLGSMHWAQGHYAQASWYHQESLKVFKEIGDIKKSADCYGNLGLVARSGGELEKAVDYFRKCLDLLNTLGDQYRLSILHNNLGLTYLDLYHWDQALECFWNALKFKEKISDLAGIGSSYSNIGLVYLRKGDLGRALECFKQAITHFQTAKHRPGLAATHYNIADLYLNREESDQSLSYVKKSLKARRELDEEAGIADCLALLGRVFLLQSASDQAKQHFLQAQSLYQKQGNRMAQVQVSLCLAELFITRNELPEAETYLNGIQEHLQQSHNKFLDAHFQKARASFLKASGDHSNSLKCLSGSAKIFRELQAKLGLARTYLEIGKAKLELRRYKEAKGFLTEALSIFEREKVEPKRKEVESLLEQIRKLNTFEKEKIGTFYQLAELLNNIWDTDELLAKSLELAIQLLNAERGAIIFYSDKDKSFELKVSRGIEEETSQDAIAISRQVLKDVVKSDSPLIVEDATKDPRFARSQSVIMYNILSILCVPLRTKNKLIGTVYLDHRGLPAIFSSEDVEFLRAFANLIATAIEKSELYVQANEEIFQLKEVLHQTYEYPGIIGKSAKMQEVFNMVEKIANSKTGVLILGENGTGKELIANLIHEISQRRGRSFIKVNCAALPETLLESELFGIEEKTATGVGSRKGKFELADGGTIFLDEVGDMSLSVQAKVLRAIEEKEFERVGGQRPIKVDVRIISATNMDLQKKIEDGSFRKDLYFRLNPIVITIPPLRERKEDIPFLIDYYVKKLSEEAQKTPIKLSKRIVDAFMEYSWPGNVRQLEHLIESATLLSEDGTFPKKLVSQEVWKSKSLINLDKYGKLEAVLGWVEKKKIMLVLGKSGWNQTKAAKELGISEPTLRRRMKRHNIRRTPRVRSS